MRRHLLAIVLFATTFAAVSTGVDAQTAATHPSAGAPSAAESASVAKKIEAFLRNEYAWGPEFTVKVGPLTAAPAGDLYQTTVEVGNQSGSDSAVMYVSKDGKYMFRGDLSDLNKDPLAETRSELHLQNYGTKGPADAKVVIVEFGDFECPVCRQLDMVFREVLPEYPQVRLVFKDFPLEQIHPWAMTAATAGRCVLQKGNDAFWKFHDAVYDNQDVISPENAYNKLADLAEQAGVSPEMYKACMADPKTLDAIHQSQAEAKSLGVTSTPTSFVDGRRLVGPDLPLLKQYIDYDLSQTAGAH